MAAEKEPFVPNLTNDLKPYEITVPPPEDYNHGEDMSFIYRVTILDGNDLPLAWIFYGLSICLGSS